MDKFRDEVWERYGYDLDIVAYRTDKGNNGPQGTQPPAQHLKCQLPTEFVGYSMGPGYWGKTFYVWPPDPRTPVNDPGVAGYVARTTGGNVTSRSRDGTAFAPRPTTTEYRIGRGRHQPSSAQHDKRANASRSDRLNFQPELEDQLHGRPEVDQERTADPASRTFARAAYCTTPRFPTTWTPPPAALRRSSTRYSGRTTSTTP